MTSNNERPVLVSDRILIGDAVLELVKMRTRELEEGARIAYALGRLSEQLRVRQDGALVILQGDGKIVRLSKPGLVDASHWLVSKLPIAKGDSDVNTEVIADEFRLPPGIVATREEDISLLVNDEDPYEQCAGCGCWMDAPPQEGTYHNPQTSTIWCDAICLELWLKRGSRSYWELEWEEVEAVDLARPG
jgi:hypothetical protein